MPVARSQTVTLALALARAAAAHCLAPDAAASAVMVDLVTTRLGLFCGLARFVTVGS